MVLDIGLSSSAAKCRPATELPLESDKQLAIMAGAYLVVLHFENVTFLTLHVADNLKHLL